MIGWRYWVAFWVAMLATALLLLLAAGARAQAPMLSAHKARVELRHSWVEVGKIRECKRLRAARVWCYADVAFILEEEQEDGSWREIIVWVTVPADVGLKGVRWRGLEGLGYGSHSGKPPGA